ncbi:hypothetical protein F0919_12950 [Taibaiella lutea]|uniref:Uncharacterized protein n=1 Tax=Taibaiella lutea TaxID=2608001 RepID=A0A5M6CHM9_9BACT|nr:hypothetical protein [Taibaiella lutea]KAA5533442.1 hypothetical protein F0919_12950 [Taibaiella lutea]
MSINKNNIADFIRYLFRKRKGTEPPQALLDGWSALSNDEIATQLSGLFQSWGLTDEDKRMEINSFLKDYLFTPKPAPVKRPAVIVAPPSDTMQQNQPVFKKKKSNKMLVRYGTAVLLILLCFLGYKYIAFKNTKYLYTITDNVSIRNDDNRIVARMDLFPVQGSTPSFQKLKAQDDEIYYKSIDNSGQLFPFRKVLLKEDNFITYLFGQNKETGYVNTNYVVDNVKEFDLYQTAFKEVKNNKDENADLKAIYRKIIIGSMSIDASTGEKYISLHTNNLPRSAVNATYGIVKQSIKTNVKYNIIAGLSDGYYYSFVGDIQNNEYVAPQKIMMIDADGESKPMTGAYRFINQDGRIVLYDCLTNAVTNYKSQKNSDGNIASFVYEAPANIIDDILGNGDATDPSDTVPAPVQ